MIDVRFVEIGGNKIDVRKGYWRSECDKEAIDSCVKKKFGQNAYFVECDRIKSRDFFFDIRFGIVFKDVGQHSGRYDKIKVGEFVIYAELV